MTSGHKVLLDMQTRSASRAVTFMPPGPGGMTVTVLKRDCSRWPAGGRRSKKNDSHSRFLLG